MSANLHFELPRSLVKFTVPGEPVSKARARFTSYGSKTRTYTPEKTLHAEAQIRAAYLTAGGLRSTDIDIAFGVAVHFFAATRQRRDVDNMAKLILDGLNKVAWPDDNQVLELRATKSFVLTADEARTEVEIFVVGDMAYPTKDCEFCGKPFRIYPSVSKKQRFCDRECGLGFRRKAKTRTCKECGGSFLAWGAQKPTRFCSMACSAKASWSTLTCPECEQPFERRNSSLRKTNYCTPDCRNAAAKRRRLITPASRQGECADCKGPTSKKSYTRCRSCVEAPKGMNK